LIYVLSIACLFKPHPLPASRNAFDGTQLVSCLSATHWR